MLFLLRFNRAKLNSEISLRDVALNFSPLGNITRIIRLRSLADFSTQIRLRRTSHNPDVVQNRSALTNVRGVAILHNARGQALVVLAARLPCGQTERHRPTRDMRNALRPEYWPPGASHIPRALYKIIKNSFALSGKFNRGKFIFNSKKCLQVY